VFRMSLPLKEKEVGVARPHSRRCYDLLKGVSWLRSCVYLTCELKRAVLDSAKRDLTEVTCKYGAEVDPYGCLSAISQECYAKQLQALDAVRGPARFKRALEIGCSEGVFTEMLAPRCERLVAVELSPDALNRALQRCTWGKHVSFGRFDLRCERLAGAFDLIVVSGVVEYFHRPTVIWTVRTKLVRALAEQGFLLLDTTRANPIVEEAWWSRLIPRGGRINQFFERHPKLQVISRDSSSICIQTLFRRTA